MSCRQSSHIEWLSMKTAELEETDDLNAGTQTCQKRGLQKKIVCL